MSREQTARLFVAVLLPDAVREALADYPFPAPDGSWSDVRVFLHGLPQEQGDACYPFVIVRWISGSMEEDLLKFRAITRAERYLSRRIVTLED